jgi:hypothetical protein
MSEKLSFSIGVDLRELEANLNKASRSISDFAEDNKQKFEKFGASMTNLGSKLSVLSLAALGLGAASVKMASDFEESLNKVDVAFGGSSQVIKDFAKTTLDSFGIAEGTALDMAALFGDMATSMGLPQMAAAEMSKSLVGLAGDLASFKNIDIKQATTALNGVFTGETESLKMLGIVMTDVNLQQFALSQGISKTTQEMTQAEKVQLRYAYILQNTKNAQGDFARTSGGAANQMRIFTERLKEISQQIGSIVLPYFTKFINYINNLVKKFQELPDGVKKVIVIIGALVAAAAPLLLALGAISSALPAIISGFALLTGPIGLVVAGIVALTYAVVKNWATIKQWAEDVANYFIRLYNESLAFRLAMEFIIQNFQTAFAVGKFVFQALFSIIKKVFSDAYVILKGFGDLLFSVLTLDFQGIKKAGKDLVSGLGDNLGVLLQDLQKQATQLFTTIKDNASATAQRLINGRLNEVNFSISKESLQKAQNEIATAVENGLNQGVGGGRQTQTPANSGMQSRGIAKGQGLSAGALLAPITAQFDEELGRMLQLMQEFDAQVSDLINNSLASTFSQLGTAIGQALASGTSVVGAIGDTLIGLFSSFLSEMGDLLIKYGLLAKAKGSLDEAIKTGGIVAIAGGAAAIALGIALKAAAGALGSRSGGGLVGGGGGGASSAFSSTGSAFTSSVSAQRESEVVFRISGNDLLGVLRKAEANELRLG